MSLLMRISEFCDSIATTVAMVFLAAMTGIIFALVVTRYTFSYSISWAEELTRYLMVWMAFLSSAVLVHQDSHLNIDLVTNKLGPKAQDILYVVFRVVELAFLVVLITNGWEYAQSVKVSISPATGLSMFWVSLAIPVSALLMFLFDVLLLIQRVAILRRRAPG